MSEKNKRAYVDEDTNELVCPNLVDVKTGEIVRISLGEDSEELDRKVKGFKEET